MPAVRWKWCHMNDTLRIFFLLPHAPSLRLHHRFGMLWPESCTAQTLAGREEPSLQLLHLWSISVASAVSSNRQQSQSFTGLLRQQFENSETNLLTERASEVTMSAFQTQS